MRASALRPVLLVAAAVAGLVVASTPGQAAAATVGGVDTFTGTGIAAPLGITTGPDGALWFVNSSNNSVGRVTTDGAVTNVPNASSKLSSPNDIATGADGNLWVANWGGWITKVTPAGVLTKYAMPTATLHALSNITAGPDGNLWFTDYQTNSIGRITTAGVVTLFADPSNIYRPVDIVTGPDGNLWFTSALSGGSIGRITTAGNVLPAFTSPAIKNPGGITAGADGNVWYTNSGSVGRITPAGTATVMTVGQGAMSPNEITSGPDGNLWFSFDNESSIARLTPGGALTRFQTGAYVRGVTPGPDGRVWFTQPFAQAVGRVTTLSAGVRFHAVTPTRMVDSRTALGFGASGPIAAGTSKQAVIAGTAPVPASATAVVMNVTVTGGTAASYLNAYPTGSDVPTVANLLFGPGQTVPNLVTTRIGQGGEVSFFNQLGTVHVIADVVGYYDDGAGDGAGFSATTPARILDSRTATGGWASQPLGAAESRDLIVAGAGGVPNGATGVVMNVTVTGGTLASYLQVSPAGTSPAATANLLFGAGQTVPNLVVVGLGTGGDAGKVTFFNQQGTVHVIADVVGYFEDGAGARFHPIDPTRILDSRTDLAVSGPWGADQSRSLQVLSVPTGVTGVVANVTATGGTEASYLAAYPDGVTNPGTANLLFGPGQTIPNLVVVGVAGNGRVDLYNQTGTVDVIADAAGYFASS